MDTRTTINMSARLWDGAKRLAARRGLSVNAIIRQALAEYLEQHLPGWADEGDAAQNSAEPGA